MKTIVLGGGRVGGAIARDLAADPDLQVTVADLSDATRQRFTADGFDTLAVDFADPAAIREATQGFDLAIGAVPGFLGFDALRAVLEAGTSIADISFFAEDPFELDALAKENGVTAVVDCGIAPGCGNLILGHLIATQDRVERFDCFVGGLPSLRTWPYEYKAGFSPIDVIEEYTRPARLRERGKTVVRPALSEVEPMDFPGIGTLEAFNTDGLRTLLTTVDVPEMREKTLRYPGHVDRMRMLRESGFFSQEPLELSAAAGRGGETVSVRPLDLTARLLFDQWALGPGEEDLTIFRVDVESVHQGARWLDRFDLLDRLDPETGVHSMARTTGYTCSSIGRLLAKGQYRETGVFAPEHVGQAPGCFEAVMNDLSARGVRFEHSRHELPPA